MLLPTNKLINDSRNERIFNVIESQYTHNDFIFKDLIEDYTAEAIKLPTSYTVSGINTFKVLDQGQTGSCVGQAVSALLTIRYRNTKVFSPFFIWQSAKEVDEFTNYPTTFIESEGTSSKAALDVVRKYGAVEVTDFEFLRHTTTKMFYAKASENKIGSYVNLGINLNDWKRWLVTYDSPIVASIFVDENFYTGGHKINYDEQLGVYGGHCILVIGYDASEHSFLVLNSWGTDWGEQGRAYVDLDYLRNRLFFANYGVL